jgi:hypothetical protein
MFFVLKILLIFSKRLKALWDRAVKQISQSESRVRSESQLIHGEEFDVWRWIQPRSPSPQRPPRSRSVSFLDLLFVLIINILLGITT